MKKLSILCLTIISFNVLAIKNRYSQSFLFTRPCYQRITAYEAFWQNFIYQNDNCGNTYAQAITIFQESSPKNTILNQYFLMRDKNELTVKGDAITQINRDIRAEWIYLPSNFDGQFTVNPSQKQIGGFIEVIKDIKGALKWDVFDNFWIGAFVPFTSVKNNLGIAQSYKEAATTYPHNTIQALQNREFIYNKMLPCSSNTGLTEIRLMLGARFDTTTSLQIAARTAISLPLECAAPSCQFFPATRGFNGHLGFETTLNTQFQLNCNPLCKLLFFADFSTIFLFSNTQHRSIDLFNKPYSRYLLLNKITGETNIPGINILSPEVIVRPHNIIDIGAGFRFQKGGLEAQIGYNLWGKGTDRIELKNNWDESYGIAAAPGYYLPDGTPATASNSTISTQAPPDRNCHGQLEFINIEEADLDFKSAADRGTLTNTIDFALGWVNRGEMTYGFVGAGGFIELPLNNCALQQWGLYFKIGALI